MIISKTPLRASLFGGGTDYNKFAHQYGGAVLGFTLNKYIYVSAHNPCAIHDHKIRLSYSKSEYVDHIDMLQHPSVKGVLKFFDFDSPLDAHIFADLPAKTGLGSSSSFTVGFVNVISHLLGQTMSAKELAKLAIHIEQDLIGENVGMQDQAHAAFGGLNLIEFLPDGNICAKPIDVSEDNKSLLSQSFRMFYTGTTRFASEIAAKQIDNISNGLSINYLKSLKKSTYLAEDIFKNESGDRFLKSIGELLLTSWEDKKKLADNVSNDHVDSIIERALVAGAYGAKLLGAGSGGFVGLIVPDDRLYEVQNALKDLIEIEVAIENNGSQIIYTG